MADRVVIVGLRRGGVLIPASELKQMMGRAGRSHDDQGVVELIVEDKDEGVAAEMLEDGGLTVKSSLSNVDLLAMSLIPEIHRGAITNPKQAEDWCARSFCPEPPLAGAFELLREVEAITVKNDRLEATVIGSCAARFYFHPADVFAWHRNFTNLFDMGLETDEVASAWALGNVPFDRIIGDLGEKRELASDCKSRLPIGLKIMSGSVINTIGWWYLMGGPSPGSIRLAFLERRKSFGRYRAALSMLNKHCGWRMDDYFDELELRVRKGLPPHLVPLCKFEGMTKGRADYLYNLGVKCGQDFVTIDNKLDDDIDDEFKETIERIAGQFRTESD